MSEAPLSWSETLVSRWAMFAEELHRRLGTGALLDPATRGGLEGRVGGDLSGAVIHRSGLAGRLARSLEAEAVSVGEHVLGEETHLSRGSSRGAALLAHELVHVVRASGPRGFMPVIQRVAAEQVDSPDANDEEIVARVVEARVLEQLEAEPPPAGGPAPVDVEALTERVYRRLLDTLMVEQERAASLG